MISTRSRHPASCAARLQEQVVFPALCTTSDNHVGQFIGILACAERTRGEEERAWAYLHPPSHLQISTSGLCDQVCSAQRGSCSQCLP